MLSKIMVLLLMYYRELNVGILIILFIIFDLMKIDFMLFCKLFVMIEMFIRLLNNYFLDMYYLFLM